MFKVVMKIDRAIKRFTGWFTLKRILIMSGIGFLFCSTNLYLNIKHLQNEREQKNIEREKEEKERKSLEIEMDKQIEEYRKEHPDEEENFNDPEYMKLLKKRYFFA